MKTAHSVAEGERGGARALMEELAEVGGAGEAEACRDLRRRLIAVREEPFGLQHHPAVDVLFRSDARGALARAGQRARGIAESPRVVFDPAGTGEAGLDRVTEPQECLRGLGCRVTGRGTELGQVEYDDGQQMTQDRQV